MIMLMVIIIGLMRDNVIHELKIDLLTLLFSGIRFSSSVSKDWLSLRVNWRSHSQFCAVSPVKTPVKIANIPVTQFQNYRKEILIN